MVRPAASSETPKSLDMLYFWKERSRRLVISNRVSVPGSLPAVMQLARLVIGACQVRRPEDGMETYRKATRGSR